jgi:hypothetical protein
MSIAAAQQFIRQGMQDDALREMVNGASSQAELSARLERQGLAFTYPEFDEAYHHVLTWCQTEGQAVYLKEFRMWWEWILASLPPDNGKERETA